MEDVMSEMERILNTIEGTKVLYESHGVKHSCDVKLPDDVFSPVIIFSSDVHFGSIYTDYRKLLEVWKTILQEKDVFLAVVGDFIDNFELPVPRMLDAIVNTQIITPALQRDYYRRFLTALAERGKLIACVLGNHESFTPSYPFVQILSERGIPVAKNRLYVRLRVRTVEYRIALIHRSRYTSYLNPVHSCLVELRNLYPDADVVVTSHAHLPSMMVMPYPSDGQYRERILIRTGSLKLDPYQAENFSPYSVSEMSTPAVMLSRWRRRMIPFFDFETAVEVKRWLFHF